MKARAYFQSIGKNVMTPSTLGYWEADDLLIELSEGTGMEDEPIFGVSVVEPDDEYEKGYAPSTELGGLFWSEGDARERIRLLIAGQRDFEEES